MFKKLIEEELRRVVRELGFLKPTDTLLSIPEKSEFGEYTSNIPLQLANQESKKSYQSPKEIASDILEKFGHPHYLERIEIAGPGFLNFFLNDKALLSVILNNSGGSADFSSKAQSDKNKGQVPKRILVEFAHPNTHKAFHIGHLRNVTIGESICRLLECQGNIVFRVTYGGDIGPHVAKALWGVIKLNAEFEKVRSKSLREKAEFLGRVYAEGSLQYEESPQTKQEIDEINQKLYGQEEELKKLWHETKEWSIAYFETIYIRVGTKFDAEIWESEIHEEGVSIVRENLDRVFQKDQGAIIFPGEKYGLHNRVFITSKGYPTYEAKELGLTRKEQALFPYDLSLHVVANEQQSFFDVTTKALELIDPNFVGKKNHLSYGMVNLSTGKMSSRKGGVITADSLIEEVKHTIAKYYPESAKNADPTHLDKIAIGAIKFYYLKYSLVSDIAFDIEQSVSLQGDSGPYLQYTYARINSLLNRAIPRQAWDKKKQGLIELDQKKIAQSLSLAEEEREVLRQLEFFETFIKQATDKLEPNIVCSYLLTLARSFNLFYEKFPVIGSEKQNFRVALTLRVGETIKLGLYLLGIETVEKM